MQAVVIISNNAIALNSIARINGARVIIIMAARWRVVAASNISVAYINSVSNIATAGSITTVYNRRNVRATMASMKA